LLTTAVVARLFSVAPQTIRRWAKDGLLASLRTPAGGLRFDRKSVNNLLAARGFSIPEREEIPAEPAGSGTKLRVLVVDDEESILEGMVDLIEEENAEVRTARDGLAAAREIFRFSPHIVFLDLLLPGEDGFALCRKIRESGAGGDIMVAAMTGFATDDFLSRALSAGADECLTKPLDPERIRAILRTAAKKLRKDEGAIEEQGEA